MPCEWAEMAHFRFQYLGSYMVCMWFSLKQATKKYLSTHIHADYVYANDVLTAETLV